MLGITLLLTVVAEGTLRLLFHYRDSRHPIVDYRLTSDCFAQSPWIRDYFREDHEAAVLKWHSYVYWRLKPYHGQYVNVDANGIRRTLPPAEGTPADSAADIFMFGGSTMWGNGARDDHTIASALAKMLREKGVTCNVTNFGESGYVSMQELVMLELQLRRGNVPDLVVFYDGFNDAYSAWQQGVAGNPQNEQSRALEFNMSNPKRRAERTTKLLREYAASLALRRFAVTIVAKVGPKRAERTPAVPAASLAANDSLAQSVVDTYLGHIELVRALADRYGFQCLFFWQPNLFEKRHLTPSEQSQANYMKSEGEFLRRTYEVVRLSGLEEKSGNRFHNMSTMFSDVQAPVYFDLCHMGETGYEAVAAGMVDDVMKALPAAP